MKLKNKLRKKLFALNSSSNLEIGSEIIMENNSIGKILISNPYAFGLIEIYKIIYLDLRQTLKNLQQLISKKVVT